MLIAILGVTIPEPVYLTKVVRVAIEFMECIYTDFIDGTLCVCDVSLSSCGQSRIILRLRWYGDVVILLGQEKKNVVLPSATDPIQK